jgi:predicted glycosyltransferase involved in capsule biosynthesis
LSNDFDFSILEKKSTKYDSKYGFCQFFNREVYIEGGLENENFVAYAPEDVERFYRFNTLGYTVGRMNTYVYHLEHERTPNSWLTNPHMAENFAVWESLQKMSVQELKKYYSNQEYMKKYVCI